MKQTERNRIHSRSRVNEHNRNELALNHLYLMHSCSNNSSRNPKYTIPYIFHNLEILWLYIILPAARECWTLWSLVAFDPDDDLTQNNFA